MIQASNIKWGKWIPNTVGDAFGRVGLYIENDDQSIFNENYTQATINIYVFFQSDKIVTSTIHNLMFNEKLVNSLKIDTNNLDNYCLIYYQNIILDRKINEYFLNWHFKLTNVSGFYSDFQISTKDFYWGIDTRIDNTDYRDILIKELTQYTIYFDQNVVYKKYRGLDFKILTKDIINNPAFYKEDEYLDSFYFDNINNWPLQNNITYWDLSFDKDYIIVYSSLDDILQKEGKNITFSPIYQPNQYSTTFNGNGGVDEEGKEINVVENFNSKEKIPSFQRNDYNFLGWSYSSSDLGEIIDVDVVKEDRVLYAQWEKEAEQITVSYYHITYKGPQLLEENIVDKNQPFKIKDDYILEYGRVVKYWGTVNVTHSYLPGSLVSFAKDTELYAQTDKEPFYSAKYYESGTNKPLLSEGFKRGNVAEVDGYSQWSLVQNDNKVMYTAGDALPDSDIILYSVKSTPVIINYHFGDNNIRNYETAYYNKNNIINLLVKKCPSETYFKDEKLYYFQFWTDSAEWAGTNKDWSEKITINGKEIFKWQYEGVGIYLISLNYAIEVDKNALQPIVNLYAVYGNNPRINHNIVFENNKGQVTLVAEDFHENKDIKGDGVSYPFFNNGEINAFKFNETNENIFYNDTGMINFNKFKQQKGLISQYLELSIGTQIENGDEVPVYLVFNDDSQLTL